MVAVAGTSSGGTPSGGAPSRCGVPAFRSWAATKQEFGAICGLDATGTYLSQNTDVSRVRVRSDDWETFLRSKPQAAKPPRHSRKSLPIIRLLPARTNVAGLCLSISAIRARDWFQCLVCKPRSHNHFRYRNSVVFRPSSTPGHPPDRPYRRCRSGRH